MNTLKVGEKCPECNGKGFHRGVLCTHFSTVPCKKCNGTGKLPEPVKEGLYICTKANECLVGCRHKEPHIDNKIGGGCSAFEKCGTSVYEPEDCPLKVTDHIPNHTGKVNTKDALYLCGITLPVLFLITAISLFEGIYVVVKKFVSVFKREEK